MSLITKEEYRAPAHILDKEIERLGLPKPKAAIVVSPTPLLGTWVNVDHQTRDLVRVVIATKGNEITVHAFGACHPNPCDWQVVDGRVYSDSVANVPALAFTAQYNFEFAQVLMTGRVYEGALFIETLTHFIDQSGRADYFALNIMGK